MAGVTVKSLMEEIRKLQDELNSLKKPARATAKQRLFVLDLCAKHNLDIKAKDVANMNVEEASEFIKKYHTQS